MDRITEMLGRLGDLTPEELDQLESSVLSEFDSVAEQDPTREIVDRMNQLADAADAVRGERTRRDEESAELSAARDAATARIRGEEASESDEDGEEAAAEDVPAEDAPPFKKKKKPGEPDGDEQEPVFAAE